jgi:hypothetical protein
MVNSRRGVRGTYKKPRPKTNTSINFCRKCSIRRLKTDGKGIIKMKKSVAMFIAPVKYQTGA